MTIKNRIALIGLLTVAGLWLLLLDRYVTEFGRYRQQVKVTKEVALVHGISDIIHQLQIERGLTAGLLASPGLPPNPALAEQQQHTDLALGALRSAEAHRLVERLREPLSAARQRIAGGTATHMEEHLLYSGWIQTLLDEIDDLAQRLDFPEIKGDLAAFHHLLRAKEYLGRVRANINYALRLPTNNELLTATRIAHLHGLMLEHVRQFRRKAGESGLAEFDRLWQSAEAAEVRQIMAAAVQAELNPATPAADQWFVLSTGVIDRLKEVEDDSLTRILDTADHLLLELRQRLLVLTIGTLLLGGLILVLVVYTVHGMLRALDHLLKEIGRIGHHEDFSRRIAINSRDEIGQVAHSFNDLLEIADRLMREKDFLAHTDLLTGLNNRRRFKEFLERELVRRRRQPEPLSLVLFDIDHFKQVNDVCGHEAGDLVLKEFARLLGALVRQGDTTARWGGEEFVVLLPNTTLEGAKLLAEKLRAGIEKHNFPQVGRVTASFGAATIYQDEDDEKNLFCRADQALYAAKEAGRNRVNGEGVRAIFR